MSGWIVAALLAVALHVAATVGAPGLALASKPLPVALLGIGVWTAGRGPGARILAVAFAVDAVADAVIERAFLGGLGLFLVGHLLRVAAFTRDRPALSPARGAPFLAVAVGASAILVPVTGPLGPPIAAYAAAICAMGWRAAARVVPERPLTWLGVVGAVLYAVSDSLLAVDRFLAPLPAATLAVMGTYWGAQLAIAASTGGSDGADRPAEPA